VHHDEVEVAALGELPPVGDPGAVRVARGGVPAPGLVVVGDISDIAMLTTRRVKTRLAAEDVSVAAIAYADGALGEITTSWSLEVDLGMRNVLELYGTRGALRISPTDPNPRVELYSTDLPAELRGWVTPHIVPDATEPHDYSSWPPHVHHYKREVASYVARRRSGQRPYGPTLRDGLACLEVLAAGYRSAMSGRIEHLDAAPPPP
jgi:predicted dehydrogenase